MERSESPRCPCVLIVNDDERRNGIGDSETAKNIDRYVRVMAAEIAEKKHINTGGLDFSPKITEREFKSRLSTKLRERKPETFCDPICQIFRRNVHRC